MVSVNQNIKGLKPSATLAINQKVKALRSKNEVVFHFGFGQSPFPIHDSIVNALKHNAAHNDYLPSIGYDKLRDTIALFLKKYQNINVNSAYLYIGPGSKELLFQTILILEVTFLIPKGSWVSYGPQINSKNGKYAILDTYLKDSFKITPSTLQSYCDTNANEEKALILNSPNNPTGAVYSSEELMALAEVCKANNIIVLSDEIYSQINFNSTYSESIYQYYPEKTIVYGGLSKVFSAGGYRLGFMALPRELQHLEPLYRSLFSETFSAVASPIQYAAIEAYSMSKPLQDYIKTNVAILRGIATYVLLKLQAANIECTNSQGGFYMMVGFSNFKNKIHKLGITTSQQLANYLLEHYNVALLPASDFYFNDDELFFRLAFVDFNGEDVIKAYQNNSIIDEAFIKNYCPNIFFGVKSIKLFLNLL